MIRLPWLATDTIEFPPVATALEQPDGLLAGGGDLAPARLLAAYRLGIFPWFSDGEPLLWWSPSVRAVFDTTAMHVPRRLRRFLRDCRWTIRADRAFDEVMRACAAPRARQRGTWISADMLAAYGHLHALGHAHSVEVCDGETLIGGIYGVAIGRMFFGESMFSRVTHASKVALLTLAHGLARNGCPLLDAQIPSPHLLTFGALEWPRDAFCRRVDTLCSAPPTIADWSHEFAQIGVSNLV